MTSNDSYIKKLLSPSKAGTFFAPFRSRSANPDGFDSKMKCWINAIEEWTVVNKKITISVKDIHQRFVSDGKIRPDKECVRLVLSEMKRRSRAIPLTTLKSSKIWACPGTSSSHPIIDNYIDPKSWLSWGVKNFVYNPASWAVAAITSIDENQDYSDSTDMSILDETKFVTQKSLHELSQQLLDELVRISKAEKQACFEWPHLLELITPILNTIIDATDSKELLEMLDLLIEYLACTKRIAIQIDNETKLIKVTNTSDESDEEVKMTKKDIATARLLRAKDLLTSDADKYHSQALRAKQDAMNSYSKKEIAKAKSLLRSHKRLTACAEQKESQLNNVEVMLDQLENTNSNMVIIQAYKDGAEALKIANTNIEANNSVLDDMYDIAAETRYLNEEMNQMLNDISRVSQFNNISSSELEAELNDYLAQDETNLPPNKVATSNTPTKNKLANNTSQSASIQHPDPTIDDLETKLNSLAVCQDPIFDESQVSERSELNQSSTPSKQKSPLDAT